MAELNFTLSSVLVNCVAMIALFARSLKPNKFLLMIPCKLKQGPKP